MTSTGHSRRRGASVELLSWAATASEPEWRGRQLGVVTWRKRRVVATLWGMNAVNGVNLGMGVSGDCSSESA